MALTATIILSCLSWGSLSTTTTLNELLSTLTPLYLQVEPWSRSWPHKDLLGPSVHTGEGGGGGEGEEEEEEEEKMKVKEVQKEEGEKEF